MEYKDYYDLLGVSRDADDAAIKKQYRKLARKYHPDVSKEPNAEDKFKEVQEAYEVLKDAEKRAAYNQLGSNWQNGQNFSKPPGWDSQMHSHGADRGFSDEGMGGFSDFFESLFGGGFQQKTRRGRNYSRGFNQQAPGQDAQSEISISLEDAANGSQQAISLQQPGAKTRTVNVKIPAGVANGQKIRLSGLGQPGMGGGPNGDLYLKINIKAHKFFRLEGRDLYLNLPITPWEAALGEKVTVPTLKGKVELKIPKGSQSAKKLRLKGKGLTNAKGESGDQYIVLEIHTPPADNDNIRDIYTCMAEDSKDFDPRSIFN